MKHKAQIQLEGEALEVILKAKYDKPYASAWLSVYYSSPSRMLINCCLKYNEIPLSDFEKKVEELRNKYEQK